MAGDQTTRGIFNADEYGAEPIKTYPEPQPDRPRIIDRTINSTQGYASVAKNGLVSFFKRLRPQKHRPLEQEQASDTTHESRFSRRTRFIAAGVAFAAILGVGIKCSFDQTNETPDFTGSSLDTPNTTPSSLESSTLPTSPSTTISPTPAFPEAEQLLAFVTATNGWESDHPGQNALNALNALSQSPSIPQQLSAHEISLAANGTYIHYMDWMDHQDQGLVAIEKANRG